LQPSSTGCEPQEENLSSLTNASSYRNRRQRFFTEEFLRSRDVAVVPVSVLLAGRIDGQDANFENVVALPGPKPSGDDLVVALLAGREADTGIEPVATIVVFG